MSISQRDILSRHILEKTNNSVVFLMTAVTKFAYLSGEFVNIPIHEKYSTLTISLL